MRRPAAAPAATGVAVLALALLAGCSPAQGEARPRPLTVLAAASLTEPFTRLGARFQDARPDIEIVFSFASSAALAAQVEAGAPADVYAAAATAPMDRLVRAGLARPPVVVARNVMAIATPSSGPVLDAPVTQLADLARSEVRVAVCQPAAPCGAAAAQVFEAAGIVVRPVTEEADVKAVLAKVTIGEVDAGVVYASDLVAAGRRVRGIPIPEAVNAVTRVPVAVLTTAADPAAAQAFVELVASEQGRAELAAAGFRAP